MTVESQLLHCIQTEDYDGILKLNPESIDGIACQIVALIRLDRYEEALDLINEDFIFEKAYCLYRTNQYEESLSLIEHQDGLYFTHLKAQLLYRLERYDECLRLYDGIEDEDVETNKLACEALLQSIKTEPNSYASLFNLSCFYAKQQNFVKAESVLLEASENCKQELELDDLEKELAVIAAQRGYMQHIQGLKKQALQSYQSVVKVANDPLLLAITYSNIALFGKDGSKDSVKAQTLLQSDQVQAKLNSQQKEILEFNQLVLAVGKGQGQESLLQFQEQFGDSDRGILVEILLALKKSPGDALQEAQKFAKKYPDSLAAQMVLLQQLLNNANFHAMESLLERLLDQDSFADYELGLTCLLVWLYERNGKHEEAYQLLASKGTASTRVERLLLAEFKLKLGRYTDALVDYEWLVEDDNTDSKAVAGYVLCLSQTEPYKAFEMLGSLKSGMIPETVNEDELEVLPGKVTHQVEKVVKQRKKKVKQLPKNYNPDVQPDPERWMPKYLRSTHKTKNDKSGFQGVALEGGGIGGTGSAKIAGSTIPSVTIKTPVQKEEPASKPKKPVQKRKGK